MDPITRTLVHFSHALNSKDLSSEVVERDQVFASRLSWRSHRRLATDSSQPVYRMLARSAPTAPVP